MIAPGFNGRSVAITERPLAGIPQASSAVPASGAVASLRTYDPERIVIDASTPDRGVLLLTDDFYPGWNATVDGRSVPV